MIKDVHHLPIRQRVKREYIDLAPGGPGGLLAARQHDPQPTPAENLTELTFVQSQLGLVDPLLPSQWHLVNTQLPDVELNVTGAWADGIDGKGVTVAIIDDGLDMDSEDLAGNFVSFPFGPPQTDTRNRQTRSER